MEDKPIEEFLEWYFTESMEAYPWGTSKEAVYREWLQYKLEKRKEALDELARQTQELGLEY